MQVNQATFCHSSQFQSLTEPLAASAYPLISSFSAFDIMKHTDLFNLIMRIDMHSDL